jgi:hypothetical protein
MLIHVLNIKLTCEWHEAIKLNYNTTGTHVIVVLRVPCTIHDASLASNYVTPHHTQGQTLIRLVSWQVQLCGSARRPLFSGHYLRNRSTLDIDVLGYIGIHYHKEHLPEVWHIPPGTPVCIYVYMSFTHKVYCWILLSKWSIQGPNLLQVAGANFRHASGSLPLNRESATLSRRASVAISPARACKNDLIISTCSIR